MVLVLERHSSWRAEDRSEFGNDKCANHSKDGIYG